LQGVAIDVPAQVRYWRDGSADDLEAARTLLDAGKIRQAAFFVHLAIEKAIKACIVAATRDLAPRSHDLLFLMERMGVALAQSHRDFMGRVQMLLYGRQIPSEVPPPPGAGAVAEDIKQAAETIRWLNSQLKNP
jgi:HEPN domain-containing protein